MVIGILQIELLVHDAANLKDKRRVLMSLKDRLFREHRVAVAEVDHLDAHRRSVMGIAAVSNSPAHVQSVLDRIVDQVRGNGRVVLNDYHTEVICGR